MPDSDLLQITVSRVIPAQKWRIIRLLTRVREFPEYIPTVKEATIIQKSRNTMKTKWRVQVDQVPISWIEEDTFLLGQSAVQFKATEGDLEEFRGQWTFRDMPEGTQVEVNVFLRVGVPAIKDFAEAYIKKLLTRNFEAILEAIERRLISIKYSSYRRGGTDKIDGFGIIGHLYNFHHLENSLKMLNPGYKMPSREFIGQLFNTTPSFKMYEILNFKSKTGQAVNGCCIMATFLPH